MTTLCVCMYWSGVPSDFAVCIHVDPWFVGRGPTLPSPLWDTQAHAPLPLRTRHTSMCCSIRYSWRGYTQCPQNCYSGCQLAIVATPGFPGCNFAAPHIASRPLPLSHGGVPRSAASPRGIPRHASLSQGTPYDSRGHDPRAPRPQTTQRGGDHVGAASAAGGCLLGHGLSSNVPRGSVVPHGQCTLHYVWCGLVLARGKHVVRRVRVLHDGLHLGPVRQVHVPHGCRWLDG